MLKKPKNSLDVRRDRLLKWRIFAFVALHGLIGLHLYLWYGLGWRYIGAIDMQELFRNFIEKNMLTVGALFFLVVIGLGLLWGRFFCGWLCHIGQAYDLLAVLYEKLKIPMLPFATRLGPLMAAFVLIYFFLIEALTNRIRLPPPAMEVAWGATAPWELLPGWLNGSITLGLVLFVMPIVLGKRTFCRNLCPWGVVLGLTNKFSRLKVRRTGNCTMCGSCSTACPMDLDVSRLINTEFRVDRVACTNCLQCVAVCPTKALSFSSLARENRTPQKLPFLAPLKPISWPAEITFWGLCLIVGFVYAELYGIGIFLAFSLGLLLAWFSLLAPRLLKSRPIKYWSAPVLSLLLIWAVVAKDGLAHYHYRAANRAFQEERIGAAQYHYETSDRLFWVTPNNLFYRLYAIYKGTGQETKRKELFDRYEARRRSQSKSVNDNRADEPPAAAPE